MNGFIYTSAVRHVLASPTYNPGMKNGDGKVRLWLVERTYSDDEQNLIILEYATPDGEHYVRKERALTSFDDERETKASVEVDQTDLGSVENDKTRQRYAVEAQRMSEKYEPEEAV